MESKKQGQSSSSEEGVEAISRPVVTIEAISCRLCGDGQMRRAVIKPYNVNLGVALLVMGFLCLLTGILSLPGLLMLLAGGYFVLVKKDVWLCDTCASIVERI
jgi:hypothetical protein